MPKICNSKFPKIIYPLTFKIDYKMDKKIKLRKILSLWLLTNWKIIFGTLMNKINAIEFTPNMTVEKCYNLQDH